MNFLNYHFPTLLSKAVLVLAILLLAVCLFGRNNPNYGRNDSHYGYQGESLGQVAEHAAVYNGVRQGMNAMFRSHRDHDDYHDYREKHYDDN
jgi:hypothetical protein